MLNRVNQLKEALEQARGLSSELRELKAEVSDLKSELSFLRTQAYENRSLLRYLAGDLNDFPTFQDSIGMTRESFDFQWAELPEGEHMLSSESFLATATGLLAKNTALPESWFAGKRVLDAGCGQGRWTHAFLRLEAEVTALDASPAGLQRTKDAAESLGKSVATHQVNLIEGPPEDLGQFDLVWSFGVLHHTGNTYACFKNLLKHVAPGGYFYLMVYVTPDNRGASDYYNTVDEIHYGLRGVPLADRVEKIKPLIPAGEDLHGWFDAVSPPIKERYSEDELRGWFADAGFVDVKRTSGSENLSMIGRRPSE